MSYLPLVINVLRSPPILTKRTIMMAQRKIHVDEVLWWEWHQSSKSVHEVLVRDQLGNGFIVVRATVFVENEPANNFLIDIFEQGINKSNVSN
jgi:hypothetical protein